VAVIARGTAGAGNRLHVRAGLLESKPVKDEQQTAKAGGMEAGLTWVWDQPEGWPQTGTRLAVLGFPVRHSVSPAMHNRALAAMAVADPRFADWSYGRLEVPPERLAEVLPKLHAAGFLGLNLTIPHKVEALDLVVEVEADARRMGAVNTLRWQADGWHGYNTDGYGLVAAMREAFALDFAGRQVVILGAGGAARAAAVQALGDGAEAVWVLNRTVSRLEVLERALERVPGRERVRVGRLDAVPEGLRRGAVVVNATAVGLKAGDPPPVELGLWPQPAAVYDMVYNPPQTPLVRAARARGFAAESGLGMLVWQGVRALEIWSGAAVPAHEMRAGAAAALGL